MLASFLTSVLVTKLERPKNAILVIVFIWIYTLILGFPVTTVKASILTSIAFTSQIFGRVTNSIRNTILAGLLMLGVFPAWLTDLGFILSFAATISLLLFQPTIAKILKFVTGIIRENLSISLAAQIGITPILFLFLGKVNLISPNNKYSNYLDDCPYHVDWGNGKGFKFNSPELCQACLISLNSALCLFYRDC